MGHPRNFPNRLRIRRDGWTNARRVTFFVTLAQSGSVTFAAASVGLSRKSAYALRQRDPAFASLWERALSMAGRSRRIALPKCAKGDDNRPTIVPAASSTTINLTEPKRRLVEAERDRFFAALESRRAAAMFRPQAGKALAND